MKRRRRRPSIEGSGEIRSFDGKGKEAKFLAAACVALIAVNPRAHDRP
jgi:hypothetical protein